jgi:hypothetical protein
MRDGFVKPRDDARVWRQSQQAFGNSGAESLRYAQKRTAFFIPGFCKIVTDSA